MNEKTTKYAIGLSFIIFILAFIFFYLILKEKDETIWLVKELVALAVSVLSGVIAGSIKTTHDSNGVKIKDLSTDEYVTLAERDPKTVALGSIAVFIVIQLSFYIPF